MNAEASKKPLRLFVVLLSFLCTPWLLFLSTSLPLFAKNQEDLFNHLPVVFPFVLATFLTAFCGMGVFYLHRIFRNSVFLKLAISAYFFLGLAILLTSSVTASELGAGLKLFIVVTTFAATALLVYSIRNKVAADDLVNYFAIMGLIFITVDVARYSSLVVDYSAPQLSSRPNDKNNIDTGNEPVELPNIYHLVFDEFQTEMFTVNLDDELREDLSGFTLFADATTLYGRTGMSIPSVFLGRAYDMKSPQIDYQMAAFNGESSLLGHLKRTGYATNAYVHGVFKFEKALFDNVILHKELSAYDTDLLSDSFFKLWIYSMFPSSLSNYLLGTDQVEQFRFQNQLDHNTQIMSYRSFQFMLDREPSLSSHNRYTYSHLIIPHFPYVFSPDCIYEGEESGVTPKDQSSCGIKLMLDLINKLKSLGRYKESLIIY